MNTKIKLLYVGFRALNTCCLYAAFFNDNIVWRQCCEPPQPRNRTGEDMIPVTVSRVEDGQLYGKPC